MLAWIILMTRSVTQVEAKRQHASKQLPYPPHVKDANPNVHVWVFKVAMGMNGEMEDKNTFNLFTFTLCDIISKWNEKVSLQTIPIALLQNWNKHFTNNFRFVNNT
jgi:hypothetical protein